MEAQLSFHQQVVDIITDLHGRMNDNNMNMNNNINNMMKQNGNIRPIPTRTQTAPIQLTMNNNGSIDDYGSSSHIIRNGGSGGQSRYPPPTTTKTASRQPSVDSFHQLRHTSSRSSFNSQTNDDQQQHPISTSPTKLPPAYPRRKCKIYIYIYKRSIYALFIYYYYYLMNINDSFIIIITNL